MHTRLSYRLFCLLISLGSSPSGCLLRRRVSSSTGSCCVNAVLEGGLG
jgi:hypothetical protein